MCHRQQEYANLDPIVTNLTQKKETNLTLIYTIQFSITVKSDLVYLNTILIAVNRHIEFKLN